METKVKIIISHRGVEKAEVTLPASKKSEGLALFKAISEKATEIARMVKEFSIEDAPQNRRGCNAIKGRNSTR